MSNNYKINNKGKRLRSQIGFVCKTIVLQLELFRILNCELILKLSLRIMIYNSIYETERLIKEWQLSVWLNMIPISETISCMLKSFYGRVLLMTMY